MNKGFWISIAILVLLLGGLLGLRSLYAPDNARSADSAIIHTNGDAPSNTKLMMNLESFKGYHHDAEILLEKLIILKSGLESAIDSKDMNLLGSTINNTYRIMDNVSTSRMPTIAPFEVCDETLNTLSVYAVASKKYYSGSNKIKQEQVDEMKKKFNQQFTQCETMVNAQSVEALYLDYQ